MSEEEKQYFGSIASNTRRTQFLAGRMLARRMLCLAFGGEMAGWRLTARSGIKPVVTGMPDVHLSISHSGDRVVCALSDRAVGVDIETVKPGRDVKSLAQMVCHPQEVMSMANYADPILDSHFTQLWTIKEAWVKRLGTGIDLERMRALSAVISGADDDAGAVTISLGDKGVEQVVAVVSEKIAALHIAGAGGPCTTWRLSVD